MGIFFKKVCKNLDRFFVVVNINFILVFLIILFFLILENVFVFINVNNFFWFLLFNLCILFKNKILLFDCFIRFVLDLFVLVYVFFICLNNRLDNNFKLL